MSQQLINRSPDLKKLRDEGYSLKIIDGYLVIDDIPYLNSDGVIKYGSLVSDLKLSHEKTEPPDSHVVYFIGEYPFKKNGEKITSIEHQNSKKKLSEQLTVDRSFSNKPPEKGKYDDYHHKMTRYLEIIFCQAKAVNQSLTAKNFKVIEPTEKDSIFKYTDTNSSRADIKHITEKLEGHKIGIIGLGGSGSYILDLIAKTPVAEIHLFDGDKLYQHNAFRAPGAISLDELKGKPFKTDYYKKKYSKLRSGIVSNPHFITEENLNQVTILDFVFICIDDGPIKKDLFKILLDNSINFIDVGMGLNIGSNNDLVGQVRTTLVTNKQHDHVQTSVNFEPAKDDAYSQNIQIAELNALNATFAVLKWKKTCGFYQDYPKEHESLYTIEMNQLLSETDDT